MRSSLVLFVSFLILSYANGETTNAPVVTTPTTAAPPVSTPTTTAAPNTTTVAPVTTSTVGPTPSTTVAPVTTTVAPTPDIPTISNFTVGHGNDTCIKAIFALQFTNLWNESVAVVNATLGSASHCGNETQVLAFSFLKNSLNYSVVMEFVKDKETRSLDKIEVTLGKQSVVLNETAFKIEGDKSYHCTAETKVTSNGVTAVFDHVQISVFRTPTSGNDVTQCNSDDTVNDMVPIAVGCALLALVVIVLIAYFIGRRRSRRLAYQSV